MQTVTTPRVEYLADPVRLQRATVVAQSLGNTGKYSEGARETAPFAHAFITGGSTSYSTPSGTPCSRGVAAAVDFAAATDVHTVTRQAAGMLPDIMASRMSDS